MCVSIRGRVSPGGQKTPSQSHRDHVCNVGEGVEEIAEGCSHDSSVDVGGGVLLLGGVLHEGPLPRVIIIRLTIEGISILNMVSVLRFKLVDGDLGTKKIIIVKQSVRQIHRR